MRTHKPRCVDLTALMRFGRGVSLPAATLAVSLTIAACGGNSNNSKTASAPPSPQNYFAPLVEGFSNDRASVLSPQVFTLDDQGSKFSNAIFPSYTSQIINTGSFAAGQRGLLNLTVTANYQNGQLSSSSSDTGTGSYALELNGQAGGLAQLRGEPVQPLVAANACPGSTAQSFLFLTIPAPLVAPGQPLDGQPGTWDAVTDVAYGSASVGASGSAVTLSNVKQFTLSGSSVPAQTTSASDLTGVCAPTVFGNITNFPGQAVVEASGQQVSPQAKLGIGPSGLVVEDNGNGESTQSGVKILGAGTGAVGLLLSSSPVSTSDAIGKQYLGFVYGAGTTVTTGSSGWTSNLTSFGFNASGAACPQVTSASGAVLYGGDLANNDPSAPNCDLAIDLGQQAATNGLYPGATVYIGSDYAASSTPGALDTFPAVAIVGQLNGKYAIFVLGADASQPWAFYLLQSN